MDNQIAGEGRRTQYYCLFFVRSSVESGKKQRAPGELASTGCLSSSQRLERGSRSRSTHLSRKRFGRITLSPFRIPTRIRRFRAANGTRVLLLIGRSRRQSFEVTCPQQHAWDVWQSF